MLRVRGQYGAEVPHTSAAHLGGWYGDNHALRQAGHSETVSDELTRALGLLAAHGVLQLTQSAAIADTTTQQWAGEAASAYSAGYGSSNGYGDTQSAYGYGTPAQQQPPVPQPPGSGTRIGYGAQKPIGANRCLNKGYLF